MSGGHLLPVSDQTFLGFLKTAPLRQFDFPYVFNSREEHACAKGRRFRMRSKY